MNPNRQNNRCAAPVGGGYVARPVGRPPMPAPANVIGNAPCCSSVIAAQNEIPCCSDVISGGIIVGSGNRDCNKETVLAGLPIAMAYVPWQSYGNIYSMQQALRNGTMFQELDLEFAGRRCN